MTIAYLTEFQADILRLAHEGLSNRQIAEQVKRPFAAIITTFGIIKRKGYKLPDHRPLDATAERARGRRERRERRGVTDYCAAPRFTAKGTKASTGERFTVTSDSQAFADAHLAAMVGEDAPIISRSSHTFKKPVAPGAGGPKGAYAKKTPIDHDRVFKMHHDGRTPTEIGACFGVRRGTISRILRREGGHG